MTRIGLACSPFGDDAPTQLGARLISLLPLTLLRGNQDAHAY